MPALPESQRVGHIWHINYLQFVKCRNEFCLRLGGLRLRTTPWILQEVCDITARPTLVHVWGFSVSGKSVDPV